MPLGGKTSDLPKASQPVVQGSSEERANPWTPYKKASAPRQGCAPTNLNERTLSLWRRPASFQAPPYQISHIPPSQAFSHPCRGALAFLYGFQGYALSSRTPGYRLFCLRQIGVHSPGRSNPKIGQTPGRGGTPQPPGGIRNRRCNTNFPATLRVA